MAVHSKVPLSVRRNGYSLHAELLPCARENAPWIVFGNSLVTDLKIWDAQVEVLSERFSILRYDQAGHGKSDLPPSPITFDDLGLDLLAVMDAASVDRAIYVGLSMGVPTGLAAHKLAAQRFAAFAFSDGQARTAPAGAAGWAQRIEGALQSGMNDFATETASRWLSDGARSDMRKKLISIIAATSFDGFRACATALMDYDYLDQLGLITCPTLLLVGANDGAMPQGMATKLLPAIDGATLAIIEGAGHVPCFEQPKLFTAHLTQFFETAKGEHPE